MISFEDKLAKSQNELIEIAFEYTEEVNIDKIYIYCSYENSTYYFNVFYEICDKILEKHEIQPSLVKQKNISQKGKSKFIEIEQLFKKNNKEMFTELKIIFNSKKSSSTSEYDYELKYSNDDTLLPSDIFKKWLESMQNNKNEV